MQVLIPDGDDGHIPLTVLRSLKYSSRVKAGVLARDKWSPIKFSRHYSYFEYHDINEFNEKRINAIMNAAKKMQADIILPTELGTIKLLAQYKNEITPHFKLADLPPLEWLEIVSDKSLLAKYLEKEQIPSPTTLILTGNGSFYKEILNLKFPVLLKPVDGFGGNGIKFFDTSSALQDFLERNDIQGQYIVQSFILGYDIDCSVLCKDGKILAYTIQRSVVPGKSEYEPAASIEFLFHEHVYEVVRDLMKKLNWSGVAHIDLRYDEVEKIPKIIEINPRYWGSLIGSMAAGVNFPYLACLTSMGVEYELPEYKFISFSRAFTKLPEKNKKNYTSLPFILSDPFPEMYREIFKK